jgi:hypothetical protein
MSEVKDGKRLRCKSSNPTTRKRSQNYQKKHPETFSVPKRTEDRKKVRP